MSQKVEQDMKQGPGEPAVSHDAPLLGKLLRLPAPPLEVAFEERPLGTPGGLGPTDYQLVAVLRFDAGTLAKLPRAAGDSTAGGPSGSVSVPERAWFPDAVKARLAKAGDAGATARGQAIDAEALFRPRYSVGWAVLIEGTDYLVVVAQTS